MLFFRNTRKAKGEADGCRFDSSSLILMLVCLFVCLFVSSFVCLVWVFSLLLCVSAFFFSVKVNNFSMDGISYLVCLRLRT